MATDALPDEVTLNRLAQRFYEASELHLVRMTDKPLIVKGLRAVFQALAESSGMAPAYHCPVCFVEGSWHLMRRGDAVVSWACDNHLSLVLRTMQRDFERTEITITEVKR